MQFRLALPRYSGTPFLWGTVSLYAAAKLLELFDRGLLPLTATGGHPWKHIAAACALLLYVHGVRRRGALDTGCAVSTHPTSLR